MQDTKYREFHSKLMPTVENKKIIGVRTPTLRKFAKEFYKSGDYTSFLHSLPHEYYEENNLHAFLIEQQKDYGEMVCLLDEFLPYVDNWATCDMIKTKNFDKHLPELHKKIPEWLCSEHTYAVRFGIKLLMDHFLGDNFKPEYAELVCSVKSNEYYIKMMQAWYFSTALAKNYDDVILYIENQHLEKWVHNKAIQKSIESLRIPDEHKSYLRSLKLR